MTGKEILSLIKWLRMEGMDEKKIVDCIEFVEGHDPEKVPTTSDKKPASD